MNRYADGKFVGKSKARPVPPRGLFHFRSAIVQYQERGEAQGVRAEITFLDTEERRKKNIKESARVDLVWTRKDGTIVIMDLKTGGANLSAAQIEKIARNVGGASRDRRVEIYQYKP